MDRYSPIVRVVAIGGLILLVLAFFKQPEKVEYDERCYHETCVRKCGELAYKFGRFEYGAYVTCICKSNITEIPVNIYNLNKKECPAMTQDRRCDESFCENVCVKDEGFLPHHSYLLLKGDKYKCVCHDRDVEWYAEPYELNISDCTN